LLDQIRSKRGECYFNPILRQKTKGDKTKKQSTKGDNKRGQATLKCAIAIIKHEIQKKKKNNAKNNKRTN